MKCVYNFGTGTIRGFAWHPTTPAIKFTRERTSRFHVTTGITSSTTLPCDITIQNAYRYNIRSLTIKEIDQKPYSAQTS